MSATKTKVLICPYCGDTQPASERCRACAGLFEPLSRQASHNAMGPWYLRDEKRPFQPGASYETIVKLIERGVITRYSILRSPTTKQFWTVARRVPGIAHLLGYCHNCDATVSSEDHGCPSCGVPFGAYLDRNYLGLPEVKPLPWEAPVIDDERANGLPRRYASNGGGGGGLGVGGSASSAVDFRRAAEPLGISSFASDNELRDMAERSPYAPPSPPQSEAEAGASSAHDESLSPAVSQQGSAAVAAPEGRALTLDSASSVATRSMQRRLQQQQSQIRMLMIMLGVVTVVSLVVMIALLANRGLGAKDSSNAPAGGKASINESSSSAGNGAQQSDAAEQPGQPLDHSQPGAILSTDDLDAPAVAPAESTAKPDDKDAEQAKTLLAAARKEDRPLKDRISDVERALETLRVMRDRTAVAQRSQELLASIADAERLLERLKLQEFFP